MSILKRLYKKKYKIFFSFLLFIFIILGPKFVFAAEPDTFGRAMLESLNLTAGLSTKSVYAIIGSILKVILSLFGIIAMGIVVYAGILWMSSKGEPEKIGKAKKLMINALIGMLIIVSSYAIASFIVGKLTGIFGGQVVETNTGEDNTNTGGFGSGFNVISTYPRNEMENVKTCTRISALFNKNVFADSVNETSVYVRDEDDNQFFDVAKDNYYVSDNMFTFYHNNHDFIKDKVYRATISNGLDGIRSLSGDTLERAKTIWFRTSQLDDLSPRIKQTYPNKNATGVCRSSLIQFEFQEGGDPLNLAEMDPTSFNINNIKVEKCSGTAFGSLTGCAESTETEVAAIVSKSDFSGFTLTLKNALNSNSFYRVVLYSSDHNPTESPNDGIANNCGKPLDGDADGAVDGRENDKYILYFKTGETEHCEPIITNVSPDAGHYNDEFTISGQYFGIFGDVSIAGFTSDDNCTGNVDVDIYSVNDEDPCYVEWSDNTIKTKVPFGSVTGALKVELSEATAQAQNNFTVGSPYISRIDPGFGPVGEFVRISGLNFGDSEGKVYFVSTGGDVVEATSPTACSSTDTWHENEIIIETPNTTNGYYAVIVGTPKDGGGYYYSNYLVYEVRAGVPGPGICAVVPNQANRGVEVNLVGIRFSSSETDDKVNFSNVPVNKASVTSWADKSIKLNVPNTALDGYVNVYANKKTSNDVYFNVLDIETEDSTYPIVVDSPGCSTDSRSPSSYKNAVDSCINSLVEARFNIDMNTSTFADNIELYSCEGEGVNCNTEIAGSISNIGARRIAFSPTSNLSPNTWYRVLIKTGVASLGTGKNLQEEYSWNFKTRTENSGICDINLLNVLPTSATLNLNEVTFLTANPSSTDDSCAVLKVATLPTYTWTSANSNKVEVGSTTVNSTTKVGSAVITGKAQTPSTRVTALWNALTDYSDITVVDSGFPIVVDSPGCSTDSRSPSAYKNAVDACINSLVEARFNIDMNTSTFADNIELYSCEGEGVNCNTEIAGSISNIGARRIAFSPTSNLSPNTWYRVLIKTGVASLGTGKNLQEEYSWNFKTRTENSGICDINLLNVLPTSATLNINETTSLSANPSSTSDSCAVLKANTPTYTWTSGNSSKVEIQSSSVNSTTKVGTAVIIGKAQTFITPVTATWNSLSDYSNITVIDSGYPIVVDSPGCSTDSRSPSAYKNAVDACINSLVEARFNIDMNTSTFADNIELYSCEGEGVNCNTEIAGSISNIGARRIAFSPTSNLSPNTWYRALIKTGVASLGTGKNLQEEYSWNFKTRTENSGICDINLLNVLPTSATLNINETTSLSANPSSTSDSCAVLKANAPTYNWSSEDISKVEIQSTSVSDITSVGSATILGVAETSLTKINSRYKNTSITDYSDITVTANGGAGASCNNSNECNSGLCCSSSNICTENFSICPPRIVENSSCNAENSSLSNILSNPSPYKNKTDACPNINVYLDFDLEMKTDEGSNAINNLSNIIVEDCGAENLACVGIDLVSSQISTANNKTLGWIPTSSLKQNNYYKVTINQNVKSVDNVNLASNYFWTFKTKGQNCNITSVDASPGILGLQNVYEPNGDLTPIAQSNSGLCLSIILPAGTTYSWHTADASKVGICSGSNYTVCTNSNATTQDISIKGRAAAISNLVNISLTLPASGGTFSSADNSPQTSLVSVATCSDGIRNWNETSVDSGGVCLATTNPTNGQCRAYNGTYSSSSQISDPCISGDLLSPVSFNNTTSKFEWTCRGLNGGSSVNCNANPVPGITNAVCGNNSGNYANDNNITACSAGSLDPSNTITFNNVSKKWEWKCLGLGTGASNVDCNANGPTSTSSIDAICGTNTGNYSAETGILEPCDPGDLENDDIYFNDTDSKWHWDCLGLNGGTTASCFANGPLSNSCGNGTCDVGLGENSTNCSSDCTVTCDNDNVLESGELCDRDQLSGKTCANFKNGSNVYYNSGDLACDTECNFYVGFCEIVTSSTDGVCKEPPDNTTYTDGIDFSNNSAERCVSGLASDPTGSGPWDWTCGGVLGGSTQNCSADKFVSTLHCFNEVKDSDETGVDCGGADCESCSVPSCDNDNTKDTGELCDGTALDSKTCANFKNGSNVSYNSGSLTCNANCTFDTSLCSIATSSTNGTCKAPPSSTTYSDQSSFSTNYSSLGGCTNGLATEPSGTGPWNWSCNGVLGGSNASCQSTKANNAPHCSNSTQDSDETGVDCGGADCESCSVPSCDNDNTKDTGELCDGTALDSKTCANFKNGSNVSYNSGSLTCNANCTFDTSLCSIATSSTNGTCKAPPSSTTYSDQSSFSTNYSSLGGCTNGLATEPSGTGPWSWSCNGVLGGSNASCSASITNNPVTPCDHDDTKDSGEECDGIALDSKTCANFTNTNGDNYNTGSLTCNNDCTFNKTNCSIASSSTNGLCKVPPSSTTYSDQSSFSTNYSSLGGCTNGLATEPSGTGPWNWSCNGVLGGSNASCQSTKANNAPHCSNSVRDSDETGVDCGGADCESCIVPDCDEDNTKDSGELCDGTDLDSKTCANFKNGSNVSYNAGSLTCNANCTFDTSLCSIATANVNGQCRTFSSTYSTSDPIISAGPCLAGDTGSITFNNTLNRYEWTCSGLGSGTDANCTANGPTATSPTNGSCKVPPHNTTYDDTDQFVANSTDRCTTGTATSPSGTGPWTWSCNGVLGGSNASCQSNKASNPSHCSNSVRDSDETGVDCGGADCSSCSVPTCDEDNTKDSGESCDGIDLDSKTCANFKNGSDVSYNSGDLNCNANCTFDTSLCSITTSPTNGSCKTPPHNTAYDDTDQFVANSTSRCTNGLATEPSGTGPWTWSCNGVLGGSNASCQSNKASNPSHCSNSVRDSDETGVDCGGADCSSCSVPTCDEDNTKDSGESCDGIDLDSKTCANFKNGSDVSYNSGSLTCNANCTFDTSLCTITGANVNAQCKTYSGNYDDESSFASGHCTLGVLDEITDPLDPVSFNEVTNKWEWICLGVGSGTDANCTANGPTSSNPVNGECTSKTGNYANEAAIGTPICNNGNQSVISFDTLWRWNCVGINDGSTSNCTANGPLLTTPVNGVCATPPHNTTYELEQSFNDYVGSNDRCSYGNASQVSGTGPWSWYCNGINTGNNVACSADLDTVPLVVVQNPICGSKANTKTFKPSTNLCSYGIASEVTESSDTTRWLWSCSNTPKTLSCQAQREFCGDNEINDGELCDTNIIESTGSIYKTGYNTPKAACDEVYGDGNYTDLSYGLACNTGCILDLTGACTPTGTFGGACTSNSSKVTVYNTSFSSSIASDFIKIQGNNDWGIVDAGDGNGNKALQYNYTDESKLIYKSKLDYKNYVARGYFKATSNSEFGFIFNKDSSGSSNYKVAFTSGNNIALYNGGASMSCSNAGFSSSTYQYFNSSSTSNWYYYELTFNSDKDNENVGKVTFKISNPLSKVGGSVNKITTVVDCGHTGKLGEGFFGFYNNGNNGLMFDNLNIESSDNVYEYNNSKYNFGFYYCREGGVGDLKSITDTVTTTDKECNSNYGKCMDRSCKLITPPNQNACSGYGGYSGVYVVKSGAGTNEYIDSARVFIDSKNKPILIMRVWSVPRIGTTYKDTGPFIDFETWIARLNIGGTYTPAQRVGMRDDYIIYKQGSSYYFWSSNVDTESTTGEVYVYVLTYQEGGDENLFNEIISNIRFNTNL